MKKSSRAKTMMSAPRRTPPLPERQQNLGLEDAFLPNGNGTAATPVRRHTEPFLEATDDPAQAEELERQQDA